MTSMAIIEDLRAIMSRFPETVETTSYGTMSFKAGKKGICRLWGQRELDKSDITDTDVLVLLCEEDRAEMLAELEPETFFRTPHYHGYDYVLIRLDRIDLADLDEIVEDAWRRAATPKLLQRYEQSARD
jgi:hypothetical protein